MNILIIAGEISADNLGFELAKALKKRQTDLKILSIGGPKLKNISDEFIYDTTVNHAVGFTELLIKPPTIKKSLEALKNILKTTIISKAIIIDLGQLNNEFAELLKTFNIPIITYITPNFWIWKNAKKAKQLIKYSQKIITIFPDEYDFYQQIGAKNIFYFGHPLANLISPLPENGKKKAIGIFPGSRQQEINYLLDKLIEIVHILHLKLPDYKFYLAISSKKFLALIEKKAQLAKLDFLELVIEKPEEVFKKTDLIISASGTVTLEAMLYQKPVIVLGALSSLSYFIYTKILRVKIPFIGLPNIIAHKAIMPEFIQDAIVPEKIATKTLEYLKSEAKNSLSASFKLVRELITTKDDHFEQVANTILTEN